MEFPLLVAVLVVGVGLGAYGYRYWLKRDPEALESWAKKLKEVGKKLTK